MLRPGTYCSLLCGTAGRPNSEAEQPHRRSNAVPRSPPLSRPSARSPASPLSEVETGTASKAMYGLHRASSLVTPLAPCAGRSARQFPTALRQKAVTDTSPIGALVGSYFMSGSTDGRLWDVERVLTILGRCLTGPGNVSSKLLKPAGGRFPSRDPEPQR